MENDEGNAKMEVLDATKKLNLTEEHRVNTNLPVSSVNFSCISLFSSIQLPRIFNPLSVVELEDTFLLMASSCSLSIKTISSMIGS
jgi:hypothetical protein